MEPVRLRNGQWLIPLPGGTNISLDHYHVDEDGTILSIKENGEYKYNRRELRQKINDVTGMNFPPMYFREE